jgi:predicted Holliday junction resolvase-like endonuclease
MALEIFALLAGLVIGGLVVYGVLSKRIFNMAEAKAKQISIQLFETQRSQLEQSINQTYRAKLEEWRATELMETVRQERADALDKSRAVLKGKIGEQLAPLLPEFLELYSASDARFMGSPIDYVIFRNLGTVETTEEPIEIILLDVKTGEATLNKTERKIKNAVEEGRVSFQILHLGGSEL